MQGEDWELDAVDVIEDQNTGSHLAWKFDVNHGRGGDATRKDVDHRRRLKLRDCQSDTYAETMTPFVDAKVAKILAVRDPVAYFVCEDSGISDAWIVDHVVPNMVCGGDIGHSVSSSITARVMAAIRDLAAFNNSLTNLFLIAIHLLFSKFELHVF